MVNKLWLKTNRLKRIRYQILVGTICPTSQLPEPIHTPIGGLKIKEK